MLCGVSERTSFDGMERVSGFGRIFNHLRVLHAMGACGSVTQNDKVFGHLDDDVASCSNGMRENSFTNTTKHQTYRVPSSLPAHFFIPWL